MKKIFYFLFLFCLFIYSCKKDSSTSSNNSSTTGSPAPVANFTYDLGTNSMAPANVSFTNSSTSATTYAWDFGDNGTSTETSPKHTFNDGGTYSVKLTATGPGGSNSITKTVNIKPKPTKLIITKLVLSRIQMTHNDVSGWDPTSGPDIYPQIGVNGVLVSGSKDDRFKDVTLSDFPLVWTTSITINNYDFDKKVSFDFYDYDTFTADEFMQGVYFTDLTFLPGINYPSKVSISNSDGSMTGYIEISYQ